MYRGGGSSWTLVRQIKHWLGKIAKEAQISMQVVIYACFCKYWSGSCLVCLTCSYTPDVGASEFISMHVFMTLRI